MLKRIAIVLLLLAIPTLSTLAKKSWYLPQADTASLPERRDQNEGVPCPLPGGPGAASARAQLVPPPVQIATVAPARPKLSCL